MAPNLILIKVRIFFEFSPIFHLIVGRHLSSTSLEANLAFDRHCLLFTLECSAGHAYEVKVLNILANNAMAVLMSCHVTTFTIDNFIMFFVVIIATDKALVIIFIP